MTYKSCATLATLLFSFSSFASGWDAVRSETHDHHYKSEDEAILPHDTYHTVRDLTPGTRFKLLSRTVRKGKRGKIHNQYLILAAASSHLNGLQQRLPRMSVRSERTWKAIFYKYGIITPIAGVATTGALAASSLGIIKGLLISLPVVPLAVGSYLALDGLMRRHFELVNPVAALFFSPGAISNASAANKASNEINERANAHFVDEVLFDVPNRLFTRTYNNLIHKFKYKPVRLPRL